MFRLRNFASNDLIDGTLFLSQSVTLLGVRPGSLIVVWSIGELAGGVDADCSDGTNTFQKFPRIDGGGNNHQGMLFYLASNPTQGDKTYTVTWQNAIGWRQMHAWEFSYDGQTPVLVNYVSAADTGGSSASFDSGNITIPRGDMLGICDTGTHTGVSITVPVIGGAACDFRDNTSWIHGWWRNITDGGTIKATATYSTGTLWWGTFAVFESKPFIGPKFDPQAPEEEDSFQSEMSTKGWFKDWKPSPAALAVRA